MSEPLFIAQAKLEEWVGAGKVTFEDNLLTVLDREVSYRLTPALEILSVLDGADSVGLVGQRRTLAELEAMGAEPYADSVILGETAYQCREGFVGIQQALPEPVASAGAQPSDMDLLTDFMLKNL